MTEESMTKKPFAERRSIEQVEEGDELAPKFDARGLMPCVTTDATTGEAHYWSRSRQCIWHKGATSGLTQRVTELLIDDDQDAVWLRVDVAGSGASCHVGYRSCFYRSVPLCGELDEPAQLLFTETEKTFDPNVVYGDAPNPTQL